LWSGRVPIVEVRVGVLLVFLGRCLWRVPILVEVRCGGVLVFLGKCLWRVPILVEVRCGEALVFLGKCLWRVPILVEVRFGVGSRVFVDVEFVSLLGGTFGGLLFQWFFCVLFGQGFDFDVFRKLAKFVLVSCSPGE
jgi:hypothetical protein